MTNHKLKIKREYKNINIEQQYNKITVTNNNNIVRKQQLNLVKQQ